VTGETLSRFYVMHVVVLPWILTGLIVLHLVLMRVQGLATMEKVGEEKPIDKSRGIPFFPNHLVKEGIVFSVMLAMLVTLIVLWPVELGEKADPLKTPAGIKPEWYFLSTYQLLKFFPKMLGLFVSLIPGILLLIWPFLDRSPERDPRKRPVAVTIGIVAIALALIFGVLGHYSDREVTFFGEKYHFDTYGVPHRGPQPP
jgi:quinol-cytochrome oxidoreductase complex cytochrome b subunit